MLCKRSNGDLLNVSGFILQFFSTLHFSHYFMNKIQPEMPSSTYSLSSPEHVAIIMDGNRRWAKLRGKNSIEGHYQGAEKLREMVRFAASLGIKFLTVYAFSTENWHRSKEEVDSLMELFGLYLQQEKAGIVKEGVRLETIGNLSELPLPLQATFHEVKEASKEGENITLIIAMNYGGRNELIRGMKKMFCDLKKGKLDAEAVDEKRFSSYLDTASYPDPDLIIRSSGECRMSNFLLWQSSYAEIVVIDTLWPDFSTEDFSSAIEEYQTRIRRGGQ